jgi:acyl-coenzyme A synthetase/AMP-(fatty) acid ligase
LHLGRKDFQVKVRGYRIEIAEIEMALLDHVAIKEAAVRIWESRPGDQRLVLSCSIRKNRLPSVSCAVLSQTLPNYDPLDLRDA